MLAFTDSALARLCIGATRIDPRRRRQWLRDLAARIDPPIMNPQKINNRERSPAARRQARLRARRNSGMRFYGLWLRDSTVEAIVDMLIATGHLNEHEAADDKVILVKLAQMFDQYGEQWLRERFLRHA